MDIRQIAGIVFMVVSVASMYVPQLLTRGSEKLSGAQLGSQVPERAGIRYGYPLLFILTFFGLISLFISSIRYIDAYIFVNGTQFFFIGGIFGCLPLFNGIFTLLTGVIPVNRRRQYLYVLDDDLTHTVGFLSIAQGLFLVFAAAIAVLFWR